MGFFIGGLTEKVGLAILRGEIVSKETLLQEWKEKLSILENDLREKTGKTELTQVEIEALKSSALFRDMGDDFLEKAVQDMETEIVAYEKGASIEANKRDAIGFILSGKLEVQQSSDSRMLVLKYLVCGDVFGVAHLFAKEQDSISNLFVKEKLRVLFVSSSFMKREMAEHANLMENYIRFLESRIAYLNKRIAGFSQNKRERALFTLLCELSQGEAEFTLDSSVLALSKKLNISRASLYRAFDLLQEQGFITKNGKTITIEKRKEEDA